MVTCTVSFQLKFQFCDLKVILSVQIFSDYLDRTAEEINEALQEAGQVAIADQAKTFNLPIEFLLSVCVYILAKNY